MIKNKKYSWIVVFCLLFLSNRLDAQLNQIILSNTDSGNKVYVANQEIQFLPGYSYTPTASTSMFAFIDQGIVIPSYYSDLYSSSSFNQREINLDYPVGAIAGSSVVTETGGFSYSIPIQLPNGTNGMLPQLSIGYNSQTGNGLLGMGWNLQGLSVITRTNKNLYFDNEVRAIQSSYEDVFAVDGNRLLVTSGNYGANGSFYATESQDFSRISSHGVQGNGPEWFQIKTKDGFTIEYGKTNDSKLMNEGTVLFWMIHKIIDTHGNYVEYVYEHVQGEARIKEILYTGNSEIGLIPYNKVQFFYKERPDAIEYFISGKKIQNNSILENITILTEGQQFKKYEFVYGCSLHSFLNDIIEYGTGNERLNSTIFKYETENVGDVSLDELSLSDDYFYLTGDFNGDGKTNLLKMQFSQNQDEISDRMIFTNQIDYEILNNTGENDLNFEVIGSSSIVSSSLISLGYNNSAYVRGLGSNMNLFDFDGDGKSDLFYYDLNYDSENDIYSIGNSVRFHKSTVDQSGQVSFELVFSSTESLQFRYLENKNQFSFIGDYNGDGIADVLYVTRNLAGSGYSARIANGSPANGIIVSFGQNSQQIFNFSDSQFLAQADRVEVVDFDGDGKSDLLVMKNGITKIYTFKRGEVPGVSGVFTDNFAELLYESNVFSSSAVMKFGDFNGDAKTDILIPSSNGGNFTIYLSTAKDFSTKLFAFKNSIYNQSTDDLLVFDINNDGKSDIIHKFLNTRLTVYYSNGKNFDNKLHQLEVPAPTMNQSGFEYDLKKLLAGNFMEKSIFSVIITSNKYITFSVPHPVLDDVTTTIKSSLYHKLEFSLNPFFNLLSGVKDGFNNEVLVEYGNLGNYSIGQYEETLSNPPASPNYPVSNFNYPIPFVKSLSSITPTGLLTSKTYEFWGGKFHRKGKGFIGFSEVVQHDLLSGITSSSEYSFHPTRFQKQLDKSRIYFTDSDLSISESDYSYSYTNLPNNRFFVTVSSEINNDFVHGRTSQVTYNYNNATGNLTSTIANNNDVETIVTTYDQYGTFGSEVSIPNKLLQSTITITRAGEDPFSKIEKFNYNQQGDLIQLIDFFGLPESVTKDIEFDQTGNITKETILAPGVAPRMKSYTYDSKKRHIVRHENELQQESFMEYHAVLGLPTRVTDIHGLVTESSYDEMGRELTLIDPLGNVMFTSYEWENGNPLPTQSNPLDADDIMWKIVRSGTGVPSETTFMNRLGMKRKVSIEGMENEIHSIISYNDRGLTIYESAPFFSGASDVLVNSFIYDPLNRLTQTVNQTGMSSIQYTAENGILRTNTTASDGTNRFMEEDASGKLLKSVDEGGELKYSYFSHGGVKEIKLDDEVIATSEYDQYGRQTKLIDANAGELNYSYNALGELLTQIDANNDVTAMQYDPIGRLVQKTIPSREVNYEYYTNGQGLNQIKKITTPESTEEFFYDGFQRPVEITKIIDGQTLTFKYTYDNIGNLNKIEYPDGYFVNHVYDSKGYLTQILSPNGNIIWEANEQDAFGRIVKYTKGDGIQTEMNFDFLGRLNEIKAGNVQHCTYLFNMQNGNLDQRTDLLKGLVENFTYDNLQRLTEARAIHPSTSLVLNLIETNYENNGNISTKTDAGQYSYDTEKFNAVVFVENALSIPTRDQQIEYNALAKTAQITEDNFRMYFTYGSGEERIMTTLVELDNGNETLLRKKYFTGLYEREIEGSTVRHIRYIMASDGLTAIVLKENNEDDLIYYTYKDHLGSIVALSDQNGDVVYEQSFDAWGRYRNPNDWSYNNIPETPTWLRGFTGHEHLELFGLINMNGRMYDPILGRMLRPDNYVQDPLFSQSYNRYSYAWNNPLSYTDPDGEVVVAGIVIGAIVGAYIGGSIANNSFNPVEWAWSGEDAWKTYAGMGVGAILGGIAGNAVGMGIKAGTISGKALVGKSFAGTMNAMYNYETGQSALTTMGYFGAAFGGASLGLSVGAPAFGMFTGGMFNSFVYSADALFQQEQINGYILAQKFVGGALTSYAGMSLANPSYGYLQIDGKYFGGSKMTAKGASYALQNHASNFAYTAQGKYSMNAKKFIGITASGFMSGVMNYGIYNVDLGFEGTWGMIANRSLKFTAGFANYWVLDYSFNHDNMYGTYYGGSTKYKYKGQKAGIGITKSLFMYLILKP